MPQRSDPGDCLQRKVCMTKLRQKHVRPLTRCPAGRSPAKCQMFRRDPVPLRKTRGARCSAEPGAQPLRAARPQTPPPSHGEKLCRCDQQSSLQTSALATALAAADPRLHDRRDSKRTHPAGPRRWKTQSGGSDGLCRLTNAPCKVVGAPSTPSPSIAQL